MFSSYYVLMGAISFCPQLWDGCYINRSGEVFACCHTKPKPYGNIHNAPLSELINSPTALQLRTESLAGSLSCYTACNLLDKNIAVPVATEEAKIEYSCLKRLHISFGEACNIRCVMCDNPQRHAKNPVLLDPEVVIRNVDLTPFITVMLRGGEPLYQHQCVEFMDHLERFGKRYTVLTNGLLIDGAMASRLAKHAHNVVVSLNGATKRVHESVNRGSRFERVLENIQRIRRARAGLALPVILTGHMTITISNLHEIPLFLRSFREFGFDRVNFGYVKETVPLFLASNPSFTSHLRSEITAAMNECGGPGVDGLRLKILGLWTPKGMQIPRQERTGQSLQVLSMANPVESVHEKGTPERFCVIGDPILTLLRERDCRQKFVVFIRHSERGRGAGAGSVIPLTNRGRQLARRFGRELPAFDQVSVSHTSILRSMDTATELAAGYQEAHPGSTLRISGVDSSFMIVLKGTLDKPARDAFQASLRGQTFIQMWLDGEVPSAIMRPVKDTVIEFLGILGSRIAEAPASSLHVHIGHDREIEVLRAAIFGGLLTDMPMLDFLDGLVFYGTQDGTIRARWREREVAAIPPEPSRHVGSLPDCPFTIASTNVEARSVVSRNVATNCQCELKRSVLK